MHFLFRVFLGLFAVWLVCKLFYSLGRKSALERNNKEHQNNRRRKKVDSTVVEEEKDK